MKQSDFQTLLGEGVAAVRRGDGPAALRALGRARDLSPADREARYWLANALRLSGQEAEAEGLLRDLLRERPAESASALALAFLLREQGRPQSAAGVLLQCAQAGASDPHSLLQFAGFLRDSNEFAAALTLLGRALEQQPDEAGLWFKRARLRQSLGDFDAALADMRHALELDPRLGGAWLGLAQARRFESEDDPDWQRIMRCDGAALGEEARLCLAFARGKAFDDLGQWPAAWQQYQDGNRSARRVAPWDGRAWDRFVADVEERWSSPPPPLRTGRRPVYLVGMLRSGTTLLESLLGRHPGITARGELNWLPALARSSPFPGPLTAEDRDRIAATLWTQLRLEGPETQTYIDKNPLNFRYLGLLLDALPEARVIHVTRDGRDSCLSCFFQLFQHRDAAFANDLDDLAGYYRGYRRLMAFWNRRAGERIHTVSYRELVTATRPALERALDFLGLGWDEAMEDAAGTQQPIRTASNWQARQPVHQRSLARWQHYYPMAPAFFDAIAAIDREAGGD